MDIEEWGNDVEETFLYEESLAPNGSFDSWLESQLAIDVQVKKESIIDMQNKLKRTILKVQQGYWCTANKRVLKISEMETAHLINSIKYIKRENWHLSYDDVGLALAPLLNELAKRN